MEHFLMLVRDSCKFYNKKYSTAIIYAAIDRYIEDSIDSVSAIDARDKADDLIYSWRQ